MGKKLELNGKSFGRLNVISEGCKSKEGSVMWKCSCSCGNVVEVRGSSLQNGSSKSCGCLRKERALHSLTTHGLHNHPLYLVWMGMKDRCYNTKHIGYNNYGGRGITVCERWLESFENFYEDVSEGYEKGLQLDRKDNSKDYEPENVRWVTKQQNSMNKRSRGGVSVYKGVCWKKSNNKWVARITKDGIRYHLGYFYDEVAAAIAYNNAAKNLFGEYANLNIIENQKEETNYVIANRSD